MEIKSREKNVENAVAEFVHSLLEKDRDTIKAIILYGSVIRGKYRPVESDVDIMVVGDSRKIDNDILELETRISLKYNLMLSVLFNTPKELKAIKNMGYPFIKEVERGEILYERR